MKTKKIPIFKSVLFLLIWVITSGVSIAQPNPDKSEFIFMDELQPGMVGHALTTISGAEVESFTVELIGIARDSGFNDRNFLLCKMSGDVIDASGGIAAGMSGSPVYFSGRLAGAVSGHWAYTDQTIGIVTPIEYMLEEMDFLKQDLKSDEKNSSSTSWLKRQDLKYEKIAYEVQLLNDRDKKPSGDTMAFHPAGGLFYISGVDEEDIELLRPLIDKQSNSEINRVPVDYPSNVKVPKELVAGGTISIPLSRGDISYGGMGTVTWVSKDGKYFLGFGHSMGRRGPCKVPAGTGYIYGMLRSRFRSSKIGVALDPVGVVLQDRGDAIAGITGDVPEYIPVRVNITGSSLDEKITMRSEIIPSWDEYPGAAATVLLGSLSRALDGEARGTLKTNLTVKIDLNGEEKWFNREDIYSGSDLLTKFRDDALGIFTRLRETEIEYINIKSIDLSVSFQAERLEGRIEGFRILKSDEIKKIADELNSGNGLKNEAFTDFEKYKDPSIDEKDPEKYILKSGNFYLAAVGIVNYRAPREIVYIPLFIPEDFPDGKGRITVRCSSGMMPSDSTVGKDVATYINKWKKDGNGSPSDDEKNLEVYLGEIFKSNRSNVLIFEVVSDQYDPLRDTSKGLLRIEITRPGAVIGAWEKSLEIEKK